MSLNRARFTKIPAGGRVKRVQRQKTNQINDALSVPPSVDPERQMAPKTAAPAAQHSARTRFPAGYRPAPLTLVSTYPEKSPYGLAPAALLAAIGAEIGRNPSLAPTAPKSGKFIWNPSSRQHERAPL
jgi:hypothetical protein